MASGNGTGTSDVPNLASHTSSLSSNPQINEHALELTFTFRNRRFQKMKTFWGTILLMFLYVLFVVLVLPLHWYCSNQHCSQSSFSIAVYSNNAVWFVTIVMTFLVHLEFEKVRRRGYACFYKKNHPLVSDPFVVFSIGNAILLVYTWILHDSKVFIQIQSPLGRALPASNHNDFDKAGYFIGFQIVIALEVIISFVFLLMLTARIIKFNGLGQPPDAINDRILSRSIEPRSIVGYTEASSNQELLIDRQMDNNNFLKRRCRLLYGSVKKLLSTFPLEQRKQHEELLRQYLEEHRDDEDTNDVENGSDFQEYLGTGSIPEDVPLITA